MSKELALAAAGCMALILPASAADPSLDSFAGVSAQPYSVFGYAGAVTAMNGNLAVDGLLTRLAIGIGGYSYQLSTGLRQNVAQQQGDAMLGYQVHVGAAKLSAYAGAEMQNHENTDAGAVVRGARLGVKGQVDLYSPIGPNAFVFAFGTLSSNYSSYFTIAKIGYRITDRLSFGPEGMAQGSTEYGQTSVGGSIGFKVGTADFYVSSGYLWDLRSQGGGGPSGPGSSGLYGRAGLGIRF